MKKNISMLLALAMSLSIGATSLAAEVNFSDVTNDDWFYEDIKTVVDLGLINGKSNDRYAPNDNLTYAEAIKLAACMNQFYTTGAVTLTNGNPWYQSYVDYCMEKGIVDKTYNYEENATRAGYMTIFANALPDESLQEINNVPDNAIPDVSATKEYAPAVYKLYRAGILNGVDDKHNCEPLINISRKEVAVIVARMMYENKRIHFTTVSADSTQTDENATEQDKSQENPDNSKTQEPFGFSSTPSDASINCGEEATFYTEVVGGNKPYTYQWQYLNGDSWTDFENHEEESLNIIGATESTLFIKTFETYTADTTELRCVVTDSVGESIETQSVKLVVKAVNWIIITDSKLNSGDTADNDDKDDTDNNADNKDASKDNNIYYEGNDVIINNSYATAELTIETQPGDVSVVADETANFTVKVAGGTEPYSYQWQIQAEINGRRGQWLNLKDKDSISGTTTETLSLTGSEEGKTLLRCIITDNNGNKVTTTSAKLIITEKKSTLPSRRNLIG